MRLKKLCPALANAIQHAYIIHYSCESLSDCNEGYSPRITSIAVLHYATKSMRSFSIHLYAERRRIERDSIEKHYDELELEMLQDFMGYVSSHPEACYVHWKMNNINYGFEAIWHRYEVRSGDRLDSLDESKRFNLSAILYDAYGESSFDKPQMYKLMEVNGGRERDVLDGKQEADAFKGKEYVKMHKSTMAKVCWFRDVLDKAQRGKLKLNHSTVRHRLELFFESLTFKVFGLIGIMVSIVSVVSSCKGGG